MEIDAAIPTALRPSVPDGTILDFLDLLSWLGPAMAQGLYPHITTSQLMDRWRCTQPTVSRRIQSLRSHELLDATDHPGRGAYWCVYKLGPAA